MRTPEEIGADFESYANDVRSGYVAISSYCVVITGNSACSDDSETSWEFCERDPAAIRRFIGALEEVKAHAMKTLMECAANEQ